MRIVAAAVAELAAAVAEAGVGLRGRRLLWLFAVSLAPVDLLHCECGLASCLRAYSADDALAVALVAAAA